MSEVTPFGAPNSKVSEAATEERGAKRASIKKLAFKVAIGVLIFMLLYASRNDSSPDQGHDDGGGGQSPAPTIQKVTWSVGQIYPLEKGAVYTGNIPTAGIVFQAPTLMCVNVSTSGNIAAVLEPAGPETEPWDKVRVKPGGGVVSEEMTIQAINC